VSSPSVRSARSKFQASLRSLFVWIFCLAVGLTVDGPGGVSWNGLVAAGAAWIALGLSRQAWQIRTQALSVVERNSISFAVQFEFLWRLTVAVLMVVWLILQFLVSRGYFELPKDEIYIGHDLLTTYPLWLMIMISLTDVFARSSSASARTPRRWVNALVWTCLVLFGCYVIVDRFLIPFLVHVAARGVDATLSYTGNRYLLWSEREESLFFMYAVLAVATLITAILLLIRALISPSTTLASRRTVIIVGLALLGVTASYAAWYYGYAYPVVSPDFAGVGIASNWLQRLGGAIVGILVATIGAARVSKSARQGDLSGEALGIVLPPAAEALPALILLQAACLYWLVETAWSLLSEPGGFSRWDGLASLLVYPDTAFMLAIGTLSLRLARLQWKGERPGALQIMPLSRERFVMAWITFTAILAVSIPTLAAFGFSFWLGPWYRW
jgi:hypothetical protein